MKYKITILKRDGTKSEEHFKNEDEFADAVVGYAEDIFGYAWVKGGSVNHAIYRERDKPYEE